MTTSSKSKSSKESKDSFPLATKQQSPILAGNQQYIPEPSMQEEKFHIYKSHVLIPYSFSRKPHSLMVSLVDPSVDVVKLREFFPSYRRTKPIMSIKKPIGLEYVTATLRVFSSAHSPKKMRIIFLG